MLKGADRRINLINILMVGINKSTCRKSSNHRQNMKNPHRRLQKGPGPFGFKGHSTDDKEIWNKTWTFLFVFMQLIGWLIVSAIKIVEPVCIWTELKKLILAHTVIIYINTWWHRSTIILSAQCFSLLFNNHPLALKLNYA